MVKDSSFFGSFVDVSVKARLQKETEVGQKEETEGKRKRKTTMEEEVEGCDGNGINPNHEIKEDKTKSSASIHVKKKGSEKGSESDIFSFTGGLPPKVFQALHVHCGILGQVLYSACAMESDVGCTGLGCFYDDEICNTFSGRLAGTACHAAGMGDDKHSTVNDGDEEDCNIAAIYSITVGNSVPDDRFVAYPSR